MSGNMEIYEKFRSVPENARHTITGGRLKGFTDISVMWRIRCLTEQFGPCGTGWYFDIADRWTEAVGDEILAFVNIRLYVKDADGWGAPIFGTGGAMLASRQKGSIYADDECYKKATTDALSVACRSLGIGADVYWGEDRSKYPHDTGDGDGKSPPVTGPMIASLKRELQRVGMTEEAFFKRVKAGTFQKMTIAQYKYAMDKMAAMPTAQPPDSAEPPEIPADEMEGLPWQ